MITREDIINILKQYPDSRDERLFHITEYLDDNVLTQEDKEKILSDLESYAEY